MQHCPVSPVDRDDAANGADDPAWTDAELAEVARMAVAGDPDAPLPPDAVPLSDRDEGLLPDWYMPAPMAGAATLVGWRRAVAWVIVAAFLAIVASGLCSTYGEVVVA